VRVFDLASVRRSHSCPSAPVVHQVAFDRPATPWRSPSRIRRDQVVLYRMIIWTPFVTACRKPIPLRYSIPYAVAWRLTASKSRSRPMTPRALLPHRRPHHQIGKPIEGSTISSTRWRTRRRSTVGDRGGAGIVRQFSTLIIDPSFPSRNDRCRHRSCVQPGRALLASTTTGSVRRGYGTHRPEPRSAIS